MRNWLDLEINLFYLYNCKREHKTTDQILKYILDNFNNEKVREKDIITTENLVKASRKLYKVDEELMITNWIHKIDP